jgi:pyruvate dehydrogenase E2 component (dihydrolipoamide acetyltransferase)/2-oxoisovalerate dehydrogenase E2 component (dihydrolipoyl transacylase)
MSKKITITLPDIGEGVVEGEVIKWLKNEGETVNKDEPVVVVLTDKATVELPAPYAGKIAKQYFKPGQIAHKDKPLYDIEVLGENDAKEEIKPKNIPKPQPAEKKEESRKIESEKVHVLATPHTRHIAKELSLDIEKVEGSGKEGRVTDEDIAKYYAQGKGSAKTITPRTPILHQSDDEEQPLTGWRKIIAEKMVESKHIVPHFSFFDTLDATKLIELKDKIKAEAVKYGFNVSFMPFFIKALSLTINQFPHMNGSVDREEQKLIIHKHHNIGIATKTALGLLVFVIKNVQDMSLHEVIRAYDELKKKGTENKLDKEDMQDSTLTISNFGTLGGLWATPIINYPEIAILAIARIHKTPVVREGVVVARDTLNLSWSFDHRVVDGDSAAEYSNYFIDLIENPNKLMR